MKLSLFLLLNLFKAGRRIFRRIFRSTIHSHRSEHYYVQVQTSWICFWTDYSRIYSNPYKRPNSSLVYVNTSYRWIRLSSFHVHFLSKSCFSVSNERFVLMQVDCKLSNCHCSYKLVLGWVQKFYILNFMLEPIEFCPSLKKVWAPLPTLRQKKVHKL